MNYEEKKKGVLLAGLMEFTLNGRAKKTDEG